MQNKKVKFQYQSGKWVPKKCQSFGWLSGVGVEEVRVRHSRQGKPLAEVNKAAGSGDLGGGLGRPV